jgi:hypothetical protein
MAKKFRLLLFDANVVIEISRQGLWDQVIARCEIHLAQTVLDESQFYDDDQGERHYIDLAPYVFCQKYSHIQPDAVAVGRFSSTIRPGVL